MPQNDYNQLIEKFQQFRKKLYNCFVCGHDSVLDLLDALSSNQSARSIAELCLNPLFRRHYSALYKAIGQCLSSTSCEETSLLRQQQQQSLLEAVAQLIPSPKQRDFFLFGLDITPVPRPYAKTLEDRSYIHQPNTIKGNKPINIGHPYSLLSVLPERMETSDVPWSIPLSGQRVISNQKGIEVGTEQINFVLESPSYPWNGHLCVVAADSEYSSRSFLREQVKQQNLVVITRVRSNRVFYSQPTTQDFFASHRGHPKWYGERFDLKDDATWREADETVQTSLTNRRGRLLSLTVKAWHQMLMRGTKDNPMHLHPFNLLQILVTDSEGKQLFSPMWLIVIGQRRQELTAMCSYQAYRQRFDMEHMLRFGKQRLLMGAFQTPEVEHEENWIQLTLLAYAQLWAARKLAVHLPRPWERYLARNLNPTITPSMVQRSFLRIITQIGTPAISPKPRGFSTGRVPGQSLGKRQRQSVLKKGRKSQSSPQKTA
jgi:hypothetical protein